MMLIRVTLKAMRNERFLDSKNKLKVSMGKRLQSDHTCNCTVQNVFQNPFLYLLAFIDYCPPNQIKYMYEDGAIHVDLFLNIDKAS